MLVKIVVCSLEIPSLLYEILNPYLACLYLSECNSHTESKTCYISDQIKWHFHCHCRLLSPDLWKVLTDLALVTYRYIADIQGENKLKVFYFYLLILYEKYYKKLRNFMKILRKSTSYWSNIVSS